LIINSHPELLNDPINQTNDYNALGTAVYFGKAASVKALLDLGCDVNIPSSKDKNSPLIIAAIRNNLDLFSLLLEYGGNSEYTNLKGQNCLDLAVINCNYNIAYFILSKTNLKFKTLDEYFQIMQTEKTPLFNLPLLFKNLDNRVEPERVPFFNFTRDESKRFEGKVPDPNETWSNFFRRLSKFELTKPPLVDVESVPALHRKSTYMKLQSKLLEKEYVGSKVDLGNNEDVNRQDTIKEKDIEMNIISNNENESQKEVENDVKLKEVDSDHTRRKFQEEEEKVQDHDIKIIEETPEKFNEYISGSFASEKEHKYIEDLHPKEEAKEVSKKDETKHNRLYEDEHREVAQDPIM